MLFTGRLHINRLPTIKELPLASIAETASYSSVLDVEDADGDDLEITVTGLPSWLSFDVLTKTLTGTPSLEDAGPYSDITINADDGYGDVELAKFTITVENSILISGKVIDGYIEGAEVFLDENLNFQIDESEIRTVTDVNGYYSFVVTPHHFQGLLTSPIRAFIGDGARDTERPELDFSETPFVISTPPLTTVTSDMQSFELAYISPFANRVTTELETEFAKLASEEITLSELTDLIFNHKNNVFDEAFTAIDVNSSELDINREDMLVDLFSDFSANSITIPKVYQTSIITLAEQYTDIIISEQDQRDSDNDGIANNIDEDDDGDGISDENDTYPLDPAESQDSDGDNVGDNADDYPHDGACFSYSDGNGEQCYLTWMASQNIDFVRGSSGGTLFFYGVGWPSIQIYNPDTKHFEASVPVSDVTAIEYSNNHQRLYVSFSDGSIQYVDSDYILQDFASVGSYVTGIKAVGQYLLTHDISGSWGTHSVFSIDGDLTDSSEWRDNSRVYAWNESLSRVYYFRDGTSPNDIQYEVINQSNGLIEEAGDSPYHGDFSIRPPITVSSDGSHVLLGSGDIYLASTLLWERSIATVHSAAYWDQENTLVTISVENETSFLTRRDAEYRVIEQKEFAGRVLNIFANQTGAKLVLNTGSSVVIKDYVSSDDSDNDGVNNTEDAFPLDPAASIDSDNDGYPDEWNIGYTYYDSTSGLILDSFPLDSACWLAEHGSGSSCDYGTTVPNFTPEKIVFDDSGNIYLLSQENNKIYQWSSATSYYSNPIAIGSLIETSNVAATELTYSSAHNRIYIGYQNGVITFVDLTQGISEQYFASVAMSVGGLAAVGDYLLAQDNSGAWNTHYILNQEGDITDSEDWNRYSLTYAWNETYSRVFFLRDSTSPNDLHYETIDQNIGAITEEGESPYHSSRGIRHPIRISPDDSKVMLGSGNIFDAQTLTLIGDLAGGSNNLYFKDHQWLSNEIVTLEENEELSRLKIWSDDDYMLLSEFDFDGTPLALIPNNGDLVIITKTSEGLLFTPQAIADKDQDGLPAWWEVLYQLDDDNASDAAIDTDADGLSNLQEFSLRTNPTVSDSDNDGLSDGDEVNEYGTEPLVSDSDADGLSDGAEINEYSTNPLSADSDEDGLTDYDEVNVYASNPLSTDSDNDGMDDFYEITYSLNSNENDAQSDFDNDGLVNIDELIVGTNPAIADSDYDGLNDGVEVHTHFTNPLAKDSDNDRMRDDYEITHGFDPLDNQDATLDADIDGYSNMEEYFLKTDPLDVNSIASVNSWTTYQGNAAHTGFIPITVDSDDITLRWSIAGASQNNQVVAENGRVFIANNNNGENWLSVHNASNGQEIWRNHYNNTNNMITAALDNGRVFVQTRSGDDYLRSLDVTNGSLFYRETQDTYGHYGVYAPTPFDNHVYVYDGYNGIYALNNTGERQWTYNQQNAPAYSAATVSDNYVFTIDNGLQVLNRITGESVLKIDLPEDINTSYYKYNAPVIGSDDNVLLIDSNILFNFDLTRENIAWQISLPGNNTQRQVSSAYGRIFANRGGVLSVFDESNGDLLWSWEAPNSENLTSNIVLTRNLAFIGSQSHTYAIDLTTHQTVWQTEYTGQLSLSNEGALYIAGFDEVVAFTVSGDSDHDGIPDWWEVAFGFDINSADDAVNDNDHDGLTNLEEFLSSTDPTNSDSDSDGLTDGEEINTYHTEPLIADSDNDGLTDGDEVNNYQTDPLSVDSDSDGLTDYLEVVTYESDPLSEDSDSDGMPDQWEILNQLAINENDAQIDSDTDGLVNIDEFDYGTDPNEPDSDNDELLDGAEVHTYSTSPINRDSDADRMTDGWEVENLLDPLDNSDAITDIDGDGFANFEEFYLSTNPNDVDSYAVSEPWVTFQANAKHNGFAVQQIDSAQIEEMWRVDLESNPHQVVAAEGKVYVTKDRYSGSHSAMAFNSANGELLWENTYPNIHSLNPPAYANGQVFYQTGGHSNSFIRGVNASTGEVNFASAYGNQWSKYLAPTPFESDIYFNGGYYGGMYGFTDGGEEKFFVGLESYDGWTPSVDARLVYAYNGPSLTVYDRETGELEFTITDENFTWHGWTTSGAGVLGHNNSFVTIENGRLISFDLDNQVVGWEKSAGYINEAAVAYGRVYAIRNGVLSVLDEVDGSLLWSFEAPEGGSFSSNIVVTRNLVFVANNTKTYAIDLDSHIATWSEDVSGHLSLSEGLLYVAGNQQLVAFNVDGDDDNDGLPNWWENNYALNPNDASDATNDNDTDGLVNSVEYIQGTNPIVDDTDADGLNDGAEVNTYDSNPLNVDSDADGLEDGDEVNTYNTNPIIVDTDGDGFSDGDEVNIYQTDPADENSAPEALTNLNESFEGDTIPTGWSQSINHNADWFLTSEHSSEGEQSIRAGVINDSQESIIEFRDLFVAGTFSFKAKVDSESCCDGLAVYVDDVIVHSINSTQWESKSIDLSSGAHVIKFRYGKDGSVSRGADTAWIDEVKFVQ